jgi:hypothetical protein
VSGEEKVRLAGFDAGVAWHVQDGQNGYRLIQEDSGYLPGPQRPRHDSASTTRSSMPAVQISPN